VLFIWEPVEGALNYAVETAEDEKSEELIFTDAQLEDLNPLLPGNDVLTMDTFIRTLCANPNLLNFPP